LIKKEQDRKNESIISHGLAMRRPPNGLTINNHQVQKPIPFRWKKKISNKFVVEAIKEGRSKLALNLRISVKVKKGLKVPRAIFHTHQMSSLFQ